MKRIEQLRTFMKLKEVYRVIPVKDRFESSAEHTWSCMMLADYFLAEVSAKLDRIKVMDLLMYHDVVEIEAGDVDFIDENKLKHKKYNEAAAVRILCKKVSKQQADKLAGLFAEFEDNKTLEAKFANAIDKIEPVIYLVGYKDYLSKRKLTEEILRSKKDRYFAEFPEIMSLWNELLDFLKSNNYF